MSRRWLFVIGLLIAAALSGVWVALSIDSKPSTEGTQSFRIQEILLGTPDTSDAWQPTDRLIQKREYMADERLAIRVISDEPINRQVQLSVRLLSEAGAVMPLSPPQITISGGTSGFCCWSVSEPGTYQLQLFRPDNSLSSIPVVITKQYSSGGGLPL